MNLAILKGDVAGQRAEIVQAGCDWICLPVDDQSSSLTSKSCHWQMEDVAWWRYLVRQQGSSDILEKLLCCALCVGIGSSSRCNVFVIMSAAALRSP